MKRCFSVLALAVLLSGVTRAKADIGPRPVPGTIKLGAREAKLVVVVDDTVKQARLVIPQALLTGDRRRADAGWHLPTIMAGLALTAAFVSGGLWLARRGPTRRVSAMILLLSLVVFGVSAIQANPVVRDPKPESKPVALELPAGVQLSGALTLEVVAKGDAVTLVINSSMKAPALKPKPKE